MKRVLFSLLFYCCSLTTLFGEYPQEWLTYQAKVVKDLPSIEGWCVPEKATRMMNLIYDTRPSVCVEVGIFGGSSFYPTAAAMAFNKKGVGYAIDPWDNAPCLIGERGKNYDWWAKIDLRAIMLGFMDVMHKNKLDPYYCLMRMTSEQAVRYFKRESIDIIHIDGNHSEQSALNDAKTWLPKVRSGGYIWFDDTNWDSTQKAVDYLLENCTMAPGVARRQPYMLFIKK